MSLYFTQHKSGTRQQHVIAVVDEIDRFTESRASQQVIYNLLEWSKLNLAVIGISNTLTVVDRFIPRISSRLGLVQKQFPAYSRDELMEIIQQRLEVCELSCTDH